MRKLAFLALAALPMAALPVAALAAGGVTIETKTFVEKEVTGPDGRPRTELSAPSTVVPGSKVLMTVVVRNGTAQPVSGIVVNNPLPASIEYVGPEGEPPQLSVDGGATWGVLPSLTVKQADGTTRPAGPADVTHVRWALAAAVPAGKDVTLRFHGVVK